MKSVITSALLFTIIGCSSSTDGDTAPVDSNAAAKRQLLTALATGVVEPLQADFVTRATALRDAADAWVTSGAEAERVAAQAAWTEAMTVWQELELMQFGPAGRPADFEDGVAGGQGIRDEIYSWPLDNPCRVDQETVESTFEDPAALAAEAVNVRGLDALEYLLFAPANANACKPNSPINTDGSWAALDEAEVSRRRAAYAAALARLVITEAERLQSAWASSGSNFAAQLGGAGETSMVYDSAQAALNAISDAMFYVEQATKDMKVATPAGISGCATERCPEAVESEWARRSKEHVLANLRAFQRLFLGAAPGTEAVGFDDLLTAVGAEEVATQMSGLTAAAITAVEAIPSDLTTALTEHPAEVQAAYDALVALNTLLKTQFLSVLDLEIPQRAASDND